MFFEYFVYSARSSVEGYLNVKTKPTFVKMLGECSIWRLWKDRDYGNVLWRLFERQQLSCLNVQLTLLTDVFTNVEKTLLVNLNVRKMLGECSIWRLWKDRDYGNVLWRLFERQN